MSSVNFELAIIYNNRARSLQACFGICTCIPFSFVSENGFCTSSYNVLGLVLKWLSKQTRFFVNKLSNLSNKFYNFKTLDSRAKKDPDENICQNTNSNTKKEFQNSRIVNQTKNSLKKKLFDIKRTLTVLKPGSPFLFMVDNVACNVRHTTLLPGPVLPTIMVECLKKQNNIENVYRW